MSDRIECGGSMARGDVLRSANGRFYAIMLNNGALAVYEQGQRLVGATGSAGGIADPEIVLDDDGILVVRDRTNSAVIHRAPQDRSGPDAALVLQDDGVLAVHAGDEVVWRPYTSGPGTCLDPIYGGFPPPPPAEIRVDSFGDVLPDGDIIIITRSPLPGFLEINLTLGRSVTWWKRVTIYGQSGPLGCADVEGKSAHDGFIVPTAELATANLLLWKAKIFGDPWAAYEILNISGWADTQIDMIWAQD